MGQGVVLRAITQRREIVMGDRIDKARKLDDQCRRIIDANYHSHFGWERTGNGDLTLAGWQKVKDDAQDLIAHFEARIAQIEELLPPIREQIVHCKCVEREE